MCRNFIQFAVVYFSLVMPIAANAKEERVALVIGNSNYTKAPLQNPRNDASDVAALLEDKLGFSTTLLLDANQLALEVAIREFGQSSRDAQVRLFYFAGHGVSVNGINYLIPIGADIQNEDDVRFEAVDTSLVLAKLQSADKGASVMILDACRDNPLPRSTRSNKQGLEGMQAPVGSLILYATAPGQVALDGSGRNGTFTKHLLRSLDAPDVHIGDIALDVRVAVMQETDSQQVPWSESSLTRRIYLAGNSKQSSLVSDAGQATGSPVPEFTPATNNQAELWESSTSKYEHEMLNAYLAAAEQGDAIAQSKLGYIFDTGRSIVKDKVQARLWYEKAASQGDLDAAVNLGVLYRNGDGDGVAIDKTHAFQLFSRAAQAGHAVAQLNLAVMYQFGEAVDTDYAKSMLWYRQAAAQGNSDAYMGIGDMHSYGLGVEINHQESLFWYQKAAEQGSAAGQAEVGYLFEQGIGVAKDYDKARVWFEKSAEQGDPVGIYNLGELYEYGRGVERDISKARDLYNASALQGYSQAFAGLKRIEKITRTDDQ